jgi:hypothetical protein
MGADWGVPRSTSCETPHSMGTFVLSHRILGWNSISCSGGYGGWGTPPHASESRDEIVASRLSSGFSDVERLEHLGVLESKSEV